MYIISRVFSLSFSLSRTVVLEACRGSFVTQNVLVKYSVLVAPKVMLPTRGNFLSNFSHNTIAGRVACTSPCERVTPVQWLKSGCETSCTSPCERVTPVQWLKSLRGKSQTLLPKIKSTILPCNMACSRLRAVPTFPL